MSISREHTAKAAELSNNATVQPPPQFDLSFDVYRSSTYLVINDERGLDDRVLYVGSAKNVYFRVNPVPGYRFKQAWCSEEHRDADAEQVSEQRYR
jgi:hypothetical protein